MAWLKYAGGLSIYNIPRIINNLCGPIIPPHGILEKALFRAKAQHLCLEQFPQGIQLTANERAILSTSTQLDEAQRVALEIEENLAMPIQIATCRFQLVLFLANALRTVIASVPLLVILAMFRIYPSTIIHLIKNKFRYGGED